MDEKTLSNMLEALAKGTLDLARAVEKMQAQQDQLISIIDMLRQRVDALESQHA